ncbi:MAG: hypothetical protein AAFP19_26900, partial [Bacteroidota bacterium]
MNETTTNTSFIQRLWESSFLKILISYVLGSLGLIQFIDWLSQRYAFSPIWADVAFVFLIALLPSVFLFTYFDDRANDKGKHLVEQRFIPANLLLAIALIAFLFYGKELGARAEKVSVINEDGESIERMVPKLNFTHRMVIFPLKAKNKANKEEDWLLMGLPTLISKDIEQDDRIFSFDTYDLKYEYEAHGHQIDDPISFSTQRKIALDFLADYFISGTFDKVGEEYRLDFKVSSAEDGSEFLKASYADTDIY